MGSRSPGYLQSSEYSGHQYANVFHRPCGTLARCPEVADPWARMEKPERFGRDVRVIHPVKAEKDKARRHRAENGPSKVPAANRAPDFRVSLRWSRYCAPLDAATLIRYIQVMEKDPGPKRWERRPVVISREGTWHAHVFEHV